MKQCSPDFLIIGAAKSGTTALYHYLKQHPGLFLPEAREPNYFALAGKAAVFNGPGDETTVNKNSISDVEEYRSLFADAQIDQMTGEVSPLYLYHPDAPSCIQDANPDVKLIAILRNPVDRAYASYLHLVRDGRESCKRFEDGLALEEHRIDAGWEHLWHYTKMGFYAVQLTRYLEMFDSRQLHILLYEDLQDNPLATLQSCFSFLDVSSEFVPDMRRRPNRSGVPRSSWIQRFIAGKGGAKQVLKRILPEGMRGAAATSIQEWNLKRPPLEQAVRDRLVHLYTDDVRALEKIVGRDLGAWISADREVGP